MTEEKKPSQEHLVTVDTILDTFEEWVTTKQVVGPTLWIGAAQKLIALMGNETDLLFGYQQHIAKVKIRMLEADDKQNVSAVKLKIEATDEWVEMRKQEAKIHRITEFIRIAKVQAKIRQDEMHG